MWEIRNSNQLLKSICHSLTKKTQPFPTIYKGVTQVGFVRGTYLQHPFSCICMDFYTAIHLHAHVYTHKEEYLVECYSQTCTRRKIKLKVCFWGLREADFAQLRVYLQLCPEGSNDGVASASSTTFPKHISQKFWDRNEQQDQVPDRTCLGSELSATLTFLPWQEANRGQGLPSSGNLKGVSNVLDGQSS